MNLKNTDNCFLQLLLFIMTLPYCGVACHELFEFIESVLFIVSIVTLFAFLTDSSGILQQQNHVTR